MPMNRIAAKTLSTPGALLAYSLTGGTGAGGRGEAAAAVAPEERAAVLRAQLQPVEDLHLLLEDVVPVPAPDRGVGAEEDPLRTDGPQGVAGDLLDRRGARGGGG